MNSTLGKGVSSIFSTVRFVQVHFIPVRYRYYADKIARGPYTKGYGFEEKIFTRGVLPRLKDADRLPGPVYCPANPWDPKKVRMGQNDYIDILGGRKLKPQYIAYDVPKWLRGRKGNELQLLLLKGRTYAHTLYQYENPTMWSNMSRRVKYLYRYLNRKTKTGFSEKQ